MAQFVGYSIDETGHAVPVSTASTRDAAMSRAITRVLSLGIADGSIAIRELSGEDELTDDQWETLTGLLDAWFAEKGVQ